MMYTEIKIVWKKNCESLREHTIKIINFKKKKWNYYQKSSKNHMEVQKSVIFVKNNLKINIWKIKKYCKVRNHFHYIGEYSGAAHSICNLKYKVPKKFI